MSESEGNELWPSITFACKKCGKVVTTKPGSADMRTVFCSKKCSDSYWKHRSYREKRKEAREQAKTERSVERDVKVEGWNPIGIPSLAEGQTADGSKRRADPSEQPGPLKRTDLVESEIRASHPRFEARRRCPMCGVEFIAPTPNRVFCNPKCASMYHSRFGKHGYPIKRFTCDLPGCDKTVVTNGDDDKRYRFCCYEHARRFWLNPPRNSPYRNQKWHSVEEYASWERRTNGCE